MSKLRHRGHLVLSIAAAAALAACPEGPPSQKGTIGSPVGGGSGGQTSGGSGGLDGGGTGATPDGGGTDAGPPPDGGSGGSGGGACSGPWQGATRSFGPERFLSSDPASRILDVAFLGTSAQGPTAALVLEPSVPRLLLARLDVTLQPARVDSGALPTTGDPSSVETFHSLDDSGLLVSYAVSSGDPTGRALAWIDATGAVFGPFGLSGSGLSGGFGLAAVALQGGAGAALLGYSPAGYPVRVMLTAHGFSAESPLTVAVSPSAAPRTPILWDDGAGNLLGLVPVPTGTSGLALYVFFDPHLLSAPGLRVDTDAPLEVLGEALAVDGAGHAALLLSEGSAAAPELAGFRLTSGASALSGGRVALLPGSISLPPVPQTPATSPCGGGMGCDPSVRLTPQGDVLAAYTTQAGGLSFARLLAGASGWSTPLQAAGAGPLASPLATDSAGAVAALALGPSGPVLVRETATGGPAVNSLPPIGGLQLELFIATTALGQGSFFGIDGAEIISLPFSSSAPPSQGPTSTLAGGLVPSGLVFVGPTLPSSENDSSEALAKPGTLLVFGATGASSAPELFLASADPGTGTLGPLVSVSPPDWQQAPSVTVELASDSGGDGALFISQPQSGAPAEWIVYAPAVGDPLAACVPLPNVALRPYVDLVHYGPTALAGSGRMVLGGDSPAVASLAR
ncbi:MAG: hypothetical protein ACYCWW_01100 [Deltaproteobacteria bacterium]